MFCGRTIRCYSLLRSTFSSSRSFSSSRAGLNRFPLRRQALLSRPLASPSSLLSSPPSSFSSLPSSLPSFSRRWESNTLTAQPQNNPEEDPEDPKIMASFICNVCQTRNTHKFSKSTYQQGVVLVRCPGCKNLHLMADNLGWFSDEPDNIEKTLEARGESYQKFLEKGVFEAALEKQKKEEEENKDN